MKRPIQNQPKALEYYLTLFKLEGHQTWRAHLGGYKESFEKVITANAHQPKVTESQTLVIDRITGTFKA